MALPRRILKARAGYPGRQAGAPPVGGGTAAFYDFANDAGMVNGVSRPSSTSDIVAGNGTGTVRSAAGLSVRPLTSTLQDINTLPVPANSNGTAVITYDDNSTATVTCVPGAFYTIYSTGARTLVKSILFPAGTWTPNGAERCVGTGGRLMNDFTSSAAATAGQRIQNRSRHWIGAGGADYLAFVFTGWVIGSGGETNLGSVTPIMASIEIPSAPNGQTIRQITFSGVANGSVPDGSTEYRSDPIMPEWFGWSKFPPNTKFWFKSTRIYAAGQRFQSCSQGVAANIYPDEPGVTETCYADSGAGIGNLLTPGYFSGNANQMWWPSVFVGRTATPVPAILHGGDSIAFGIQAADGPGDGSGGGGWFLRAAFNYDGNGAKMPNSTFARSGMGTGSWSGTITNGVAQYQKKQTLYKYFDHFFNDHAHNSSFNLATEQANMKQMWSDAKNAPGSTIKNVQHYAMIPDTSGAGDFSSAAAQTSTNNGWNQFRAQWNPWLASAVGSFNLDGVIDLQSSMVDGGNPNIWWTNGTARATTPEGTHPTNLSCIRMAVQLAPILNALTLAG